MRNWELIRAARHDLTDYVIHFTRSGYDEEVAEFFGARERLLKILRDGYIRPTFAPLPNRYNSTPRNTIKGPTPVVCLTEQPLWAVLALRSSGATQRYSGYGIAYHKCLIHGRGAQPVIYASKGMLGKKIKDKEEGYEEGKEIFRDGLPKDMQWLWSNYDPEFPGQGVDPIDFTWEREWRYRPLTRQGEKGMPAAIPHGYANICGGAIIVEKDEDVPVLDAAVKEAQKKKLTWPKHLNRIISLETVKRQLEAGKREYGRLETWPES